HKITRAHAGGDSIELVRNPDIAATLGRERRAGQVLVGFALETDNGPANAREKLARKNLDMIVLNTLADKGAGFGVDTNKVTVITADSETTFPLKSKAEVASDILDCITPLI
ncbi:MAG: phosphopantothenoylcysteine decarboxylase, partial [Muribaculaceae bacterium]|nr:phosphopantothenoylcysteine decarboxylase [Muribaculaceae bacterium]